MKLFDLQKHIKREKISLLIQLRKSINKQVPDESIGREIAVKIIDNKIQLISDEISR